jgi:hypothetical protein
MGPEKFITESTRISHKTLLVQPVVDLRTRWPGFDNRSCRICGGRGSTGADFLQILRFSLPIFFPPNATHSSTIQGWYNGPYNSLHVKWTQFTNHYVIIRKLLETIFNVSWVLISP